MPCHSILDLCIYLENRWTHGWMMLDVNCSPISKFQIIQIYIVCIFSSNHWCFPRCVQALAPWISACAKVPLWSEIGMAFGMATFILINFMNMIGEVQDTMFLLGFCCSVFFRGFATICINLCPTSIWFGFIFYHAVIPLSGHKKKRATETYVRCFTGMSSFQRLRGPGSVIHNEHTPPINSLPDVVVPFAL